MPKGIVRNTNSYRNGTPVNLPVSPGTAITLPHEFGTRIPVADQTLAKNQVTWLPNPAHFGNPIPAGSPDPAVTLIASSAATDNGSFSDSITTSAFDSTGATFLCVSASCYVGTDLTLTDSFGNTWVLAQDQSLLLSGLFLLTNSLYYAFNPTVGAGHTVTLSSSGGADCAVAVAAFAGTPITDPLEGGSEMVSGIFASGSLQGLPITPASAGDLIVQAFVGDSTGTVSVDSGFLIPDSAGIGHDGIGAALGYLITTDTSAQNPTWTQDNISSRYMGCVGAAFAKG